jgi:hypothetical protein
MSMRAVRGVGDRIELSPYLRLPGDGRGPCGARAGAGSWIRAFAGKTGDRAPGERGTAPSPYRSYSRALSHRHRRTCSDDPCVVRRQRLSDMRPRPRRSCSWVVGTSPTMTAVGRAPPLPSGRAQPFDLMQASVPDEPGWSSMALEGRGRQGRTPTAPAPPPAPNSSLTRRLRKLGRPAQADGPGRPRDQRVLGDAGDGLFQSRPA